MAGKPGRSGKTLSTTKPKPGGKPDGRLKVNKGKGKGKGKRKGNLAPPFTSKNQPKPKGGK